MSRESILIAVLLPLANCVQPYRGVVGKPVPEPVLVTQDQTVRIEEQDRINRFRRLANMQGITPPNVEQIILPPGSVDFMSGPVPVVRVIFPERAFFAFDSDAPLPSSEPILDLIAENMKRDVPDAGFTVLGHTDAIGTNEYNVDLSRRRAEAVMRALVARGVNPDQLNEVAIGKRQPIAPNDTPENRALNRRVEFLASAALSANLAAVQQRVIPESYFATDSTRRRSPLSEFETPQTEAPVYKLLPKNVLPGGPAEPNRTPLDKYGDLKLNPVIPQQYNRQNPEQVQPAPLSPGVPPPVLSQPSEVYPRGLGDPQPYD